MRVNAFHLKLIAITTMLIDHIGVVFFPNNHYLTLVGRIAFPLFAWFIANGYIYTRDPGKYALRLFLFALIAQVPYILALKGGVPQNPLFYLSELNVLFTLLLGLASIHFYKRFKQYYPFALCLLALFCMLALTFKTDYMCFGVLSVFFFYIYYNNFIGMFISQSIIYALTYSFFFLPFFENPMQNVFDPQVYYIFTALVPLLLLKLYSGQSGPKLKYFFYIFYPAHLTLLFILSLYLK